MTIIETSQEKPAKIIKIATQVLHAGGLMIFPTETTYGAGVDATNPQAVNKLLSYKSRREGKPLSIAVTNKQMASKYVKINEQADKLYQRFLPGPVTIVSKGRGTVAPGVESEFGTLGVRIPDYQLILDLIKAYGQPITATSANASGKKRPYQIQDILDNLSAKQKSLIDLIIDAGQLPHNEPSTVIDTTTSTPITLRAGKNSVKTRLIASLRSQSPAQTKQIAGKLLLKHWEKLKAKGLIIGLNGPLGTGKTIFAKGAAQFLQIEEEITSPTYTYINEYDFKRHKIIGKFCHADLWKIDSQEAFDLLNLPTLVSQPLSLLVVEWWDQVAEFAKKQGVKPDMIINFEEENNERLLKVIQSHS